MTTNHSKFTIPKAIEDAANAHSEAANHLINTIKSEYPEGCEIECTIGRARIRAKVTGYGCAWHRPAHMIVENVVTGKRRTISADSLFHAIKKV